MTTLSEISIHAWLHENQIKNEKGDLIEFTNHMFLFDIYADESDFLVVIKGAQVGLSTLEVIKNFYDAYKNTMDIIYCADEKTEVMTRRGFLYQHEVLDTDEILTLGLDNVTRWTKPDFVFRKEVDMECIEFNQRNFNALVTKDHRWLVKQYQGDELYFTDTQSMVGKYLKIPKFVEKNEASTKNKRYSNDYIILLSWIFAEGNYPKQTKGSGKKSNGITITQSEKVNKMYCNEIRSLLERLGFRYKEYKNNRGIIDFKFAFEPGKEIRERFPNKVPDSDFVNELTKEQCKLFIDTFVKADGWIDKHGTSAIMQKDKQCVEMLVMMSVLAGYVPSIQARKSDDCTTIRLVKYKYVETNELKPKYVNYKGIIWCPSTEHGTFYARRNGRCYWTGNTLPTGNDITVFVGGKVNRIIANNPILLEYTKDKDSVEQKTVGEKSMIYFRGSWSKKAAIMVTADRLVHDEKDSSKQDVIAEFQARLQHSKYKQIHVFSHPSVPGHGVDVEWQKSDQKHWFITCPHCDFYHYMDWNLVDDTKMSVDFETKKYICKKCKGELSDNDRRNGAWVAKYKKTDERKYSGYWVPLLIAPYVTARELIDKWNDDTNTEDFFYNKVLGLPFAGSGNVVDEETILGNVTSMDNDQSGPIVIGVDTGIDIRYVIGNAKGIFTFGQCEKASAEHDPYDELRGFLAEWKDSIMVIDQGGDIIGARKLREEFPGRVFLCHYRNDRKTMKLITWGKNEESGNVVVDRNRCIQLVIDEFKSKRLALFGSKAEWFPYWLHWKNIYKVTEENPQLLTKTFKWLRKGRDDWVHATVYWRAGISKFAEKGHVVHNKHKQKPDSYEVNPDGSMSFNPEEHFDFYGKQDDDWRNI